MTGLNVFIPVLLFALFIFPSFIFADHAKIAIYFKDGSEIKHTADSYWTIYKPHHNHYYFITYDNYKMDDNYLCFADYCNCDPVSHDTEEADYTKLRDEIIASGNECYYKIERETRTDRWCISVRYDQMDKCRVYTEGHWVTLYEYGNKYN